MARAATLTAFLAFLVVLVFSPAARQALSPQGVVEEDLCARFDLEEITHSRISLDGGATWRPAGDGQSPCSYYLSWERLSPWQGPVVLALSDLGGQAALWQVGAEGEQLLAQGDLAISTAAPPENLQAWMIGALSVLLFAALVYFARHARVQTRLLEEIRQTAELTGFLLLKTQRQAADLTELPGGASGWLARCGREAFGCELKIAPEGIEVFSKIPLICVGAEDGALLAVSPHPRQALLERARMDAPSRSKLARLSPRHRALRAVRKGLTACLRLGPAGETFDIEARMLAQALGFSWGQPDALHFFLLEGGRG